jgi:hypothetical protein
MYEHAQEQSRESSPPAKLGQCRSRFTTGTPLRRQPARPRRSGSARWLQLGLARRPRVALDTEQRPAHPAAAGAAGGWNGLGHRCNTYSPFGEPERATGRWLPYLRFGTAGALTGIAVGLLSAGAAAAHLPGGTLDVVRNVAGITGIGLISAAVIGGGLSWIGPMAYLVLSEDAILNAWRTPWIWPTRPSHDAGAALCAALVFVAGTAITTARGARQRAHE